MVTMANFVTGPFLDLFGEVVKSHLKYLNIWSSFLIHIMFFVGFNQRKSFSMKLRECKEFAKIKDAKSTDIKQFG